MSTSINRSKLLIIYFLFVLLGIFLIPNTCSAIWDEEFPDASKYLLQVSNANGRKISKIVFLNEKSTPELVRQHILAAAYMKEYRPSLIQNLLHWFHESQIDTRIEFYVELAEADFITLFVGFKERRKITKIAFDGNASISNNLLGAQIDLKEGVDYEPNRVAENERKIIDFYNRQGYLNTNVKYTLSDTGALLYAISEGAPTLVDDVVIAEMKNIEDKRLRKYFLEELATAFGLERNDKIERDKVQAGLQNIKNWLREHDYLVAKDPTIIYEIAGENRVRIKINIDYGQRIRFGFRGNKHFSYRELIDYVGEIKEVNSGSDYLDSVRRRIIDAYKEIGMVNATINTLVRENPEKGIQYISLIISEGEKVRISSIKVEGIYSMPANDIEDKLSSFSSRLVQRHFFQESGINKAANLLADYLKSLGYLSAKLEFSKFDFSKDRKSVDITLLFNEGVQSFVQSVNINGLKGIPLDEALAMLGLKEGEQFNIFKFESGLNALKEHYQELGNLNAQITNEGSNSIVKYSRDNSAVSIELDISEGPLMKVGEIIVRGNQNTHARVVFRELPFIAGDVLTKPLLNEAEDNLRKLNLFTSVVVRTIDHPGDETKKDILILVEESTPGSFEVAPGFRNDLGLRLGIGSTYQNLGGWNRSVSANAVFNRRVRNYHFPEYSIGLGFREPYFANWPVVLSSNLNFLRRQYSKFDAYISKLTTSLKRDITKNFSVFLEYSYEQDTIKNAQPPYTLNDNRQSFIGALTPGFIFDTRNDTFNPSRGFYSVNRFELASRFFGSQPDIGYYRTTTSNSTYLSVYDNIVLALGMSFGYERSNIVGSEIPAFKLFRLGGIGSVRGYDDDSIEVETHDKINGTLGLINYRSELRVPVNGAFGTALFLDAGNLMVDRFAPLDNLRSSLGAGLRYVTPVGPVALDFAWKLQTSDKVGDTSLQGGDRYKVHFAIGTF